MKNMSGKLFVNDVFSRNYKTVNENDTLSKCWNLFKTEKSPVLAVVNEKKKYIGIITRKWVVRSKVDHTITKVKTLTKKTPIISPDFTFSKAAKLMIESGIRQLPVFVKKKMIGFITDTQIIQNSLEKNLGNRFIEEIMTKTPKIIEENRSIGAVLNVIREYGISHVPITSNEKLVGIISIQDILDHVYQPKNRQTKGEIIGEKRPLLNIPAKGIMIKSVITISPKEKLKDAIKKMEKNNISSLVVLKNNKIIGIVTKLDLLEPISQKEKRELPFEIQFGIKGLSISLYQKEILSEEFKSFISKYKEGLISGTLFVYMKIHGESHRGLPLIHCRLQLKTAKGAFFSSAESYGIEYSFRIALNKLDRRLLRSKELAFNQKFAKDFLRKMEYFRY